MAAVAIVAGRAVLVRNVASMVRPEAGAVAAMAGAVAATAVAATAVVAVVVDTAVATVVLTMGAGLGAVWLAAFRLTGSVGAAWAAWLALLGAAPVLLHGFTIYPDPAGAAAMAVAVLALVGLDRGTISLRPGTWAALGAVLAALPWLHTRFALLAGGLGLAMTLLVGASISAQSASPLIGSR